MRILERLRGPDRLLKRCIEVDTGEGIVDREESRTNDFSMERTVLIGPA